MNKKAGFYRFALRLIFIAVFNAVVFLVSSNFTPTFWISWGFIHLAYLMLTVSPLAVPQGKNAVILGYSLLYVSSLYFAVAGLTGLIFMVFRNADFRYVLVPQLVMAGLYGAVFLSSLIANEKTISDGQQSSNNIFYIKNAAAEINMLMEHTQSPEFKKSLERLYDAVMSSQVKSYPALAGTEHDLMKNIEKLKEAVLLGQYDEAILLADAAGRLLAERNTRLGMLR